MRQRGHTVRGHTAHGRTLHGHTLHGRTLHGRTLHGHTLHGHTLHGHTLHGPAVIGPSNGSPELIGVHRIRALTAHAMIAGMALPLWLAAPLALARAAGVPGPVAEPERPPGTKQLSPAVPRPGPAPKVPTASSRAPAAKRLGTTMTAKPPPLPDNLTWRGLPANAVTIRDLVAAKKLEQALHVTDLVLRREPRNTEVGMQRARLLYWLGRKPEAEKQATAVYRTDHYDTGALRLVGAIRLGRKDIRGAIRAYREAVLRGDADLDLKYRLIDLYIRIDRPELARALVRPGMVLPDELGWQLERAIARWRAEVYGAMATFQTSARAQLWERGQASLSYTWSPRYTFLAGLYAERRGADRMDTQLVGQLYYGLGRLSGDLRGAFSPALSDFLPGVDIWLDGAYNFGKFAIGGWVRYASYPIAPLMSLGPFVQLNMGRFLLKPGYLMVLRGDFFGDPQFDSTFYVKGRWAIGMKSAAFAWLYYGQEAAFSRRRRILSPDESAASLVLGGGHWLTYRWGLRGMLTYLRYVRGQGGIIVEFLLALRARF